MISASGRRRTNILPSTFVSLTPGLGPVPGLQSAAAGTRWKLELWVLCHSWDTARCPISLVTYQLGTDSLAGEMWMVVLHDFEFTINLWWWDNILQKWMNNKWSPRFQGWRFWRGWRVWVSQQRCWRWSSSHFSPRKLQVSRVMPPLSRILNQRINFWNQETRFHW